MILVNVTIWIWRFYSSRCYHDEVIKWKHFPRYWPFVRGNHRPPVNDVTEMRAPVGTKATLWSCSLCMNTVKGSTLLGQDCDHLLRCAYRLQISWLHFEWHIFWYRKLDLLERLYDINQFNPRCVKQIVFLPLGSKCNDSRVNMFMPLIWKELLTWHRKKMSFNNHGSCDRAKNVFPYWSAYQNA